MKYKNKEQATSFRMAPWKALYVKRYLSSRSKFQIFHKEKEKEIQSHYMKLPIGRLNITFKSRNGNVGV